MSGGSPAGPGTDFELLLDEDRATGAGLPSSFKQVYGGDWRIPAPSDERPYCYANFVVSRDGRVSFDEPGHLGGGDVSLFSQHDRWLMGLLRARCDAILVGDNTLRLELDHIWTAEFIYPVDVDAYAALRVSEGRERAPLHVFLSLSGDVPRDAAIFDREDIPVLVATTSEGRETASRCLARRANLTVIDLGEQSVDLARLTALLRGERRVRSLLCEGGPRVYGAMVAAGQIDDEFLTLSPIQIGQRLPDAGRPRPSLIEGVAFAPGASPVQTLISVRRAGGHLFLRSRYQR